MDIRTGAENNEGGIGAGDKTQWPQSGVKMMSCHVGNESYVSPKGVSFLPHSILHTCVCV